MLFIFMLISTTFITSNKTFSKFQFHSKPVNWWHDNFCKPLKCQMLESDLLYISIPIFIRLFIFDGMPAPESIYSELLIKFETSVLKIQFLFRTDLGAVDRQYQIQPLPTNVVFLAGHHELRVRNQFSLLALIQNSYKHFLSRSQKCW